MARKLKSDKLLFMATLLLVCTSVVMVYSASAVIAMDRYQQPYWFLIKQGTWAMLGVFLLIVTMRIDYRTYREPVVIWTALAVAAIALVAVLFREPINGTRRWFGIGGIGVQPSELAKMTAILFCAALLGRRMDRIIAGLAGLILLQPDYGTAVSLLVIVGAIVFAAGLNYRYIAGLVLVMLPVL